MKVEKNPEALAIVLAVGMLVFLTASAGAAVIYVDDNAHGLRNGSSWADAFTDLQEALDAAADDDEIRIARGLYRPTVPNGDRNISFAITRRITLRGGFAGAGADDPDDRDIADYKTILSGDLNGDDAIVAVADLPTEPSRAENSYHVVTALDWKQTAGTVLDGLVITAGNANGDAYTQRSGGGVESRNTVELKNCVIEHNSALDSGGACAWPGPLYDCLLRDNYAQAGGGIYGPDRVTGCVIEGNVASIGGGIDSPRSKSIYRDCIIRDNVANTGGAIAMGNEQLILVRCALSGNHASEKGGAIRISSDCTCWSELRIYQCRLWGNSAGESGGAVYINGNSMVYLYSTMLWGNNAASDGGALYCNLYAGMRDEGHCSIINCTFASNTAGNLGGGVCCHTESGHWFRLVNSILWGNADKSGLGTQEAQIQTGPSTVGTGTGDPGPEPPAPVLVPISHCCIQGWNGQFGGQGNTGDNPMFVDPDGADEILGNLDDDMHLQWGSPLINAGSNTIYGSWTNTTPQQDCNDWQAVYDGDCRLDLADLDGNPRIANQIVDMGAYEHQGHGPNMIYVDDDAPGLNNGSSWADAFNCLVDALAAAHSGDTIFVAEGLYKPNQGAAVPEYSRDATFALKAAVTVRGGYAGFGRPEPDARNVKLYPTILSGDLAGDDSDPDTAAGMANDHARENNSFHVVTGSPFEAAAVLDGFIITGGHADRSGPLSDGAGIYLNGGSTKILNCLLTANAADDGAAVYCDDGTVTVSDCNIIKNLAFDDGGGMYLRDSRSTVTRCLLKRNRAAEGGAMRIRRGNANITASTFLHNEAPEVGGGAVFLRNSDSVIKDCAFHKNATDADYSEGGGAIFSLESSPVVTGCTFIDNYTIGGTGGAILCKGGGAPTIAGCTFLTNEGAAVTCAHTGRPKIADSLFRSNLGHAILFRRAGSPLLKGCVIIDNKADAIQTGSATSPVITNCLIAGNDRGLCCSYGDAEIVNCTIVANATGLAAANAEIHIRNTILGDEPAQWAASGDGTILSEESVLSIEYSDVQGGFEGRGNIDLDPCFADPALGDYHLKSQAGRWDPQHEKWIADKVTSPCIDTGDMLSPIGIEPFPNGGIVNMGAYAGTAEASKSYFGRPVCKTVAAGDINGDCRVDFLDFAIMAAHWAIE
ncbi:MAG: right-handed parallel beta-helix repeat-containing protein [Phycisphaerales bacterium]|nr:MAG: right-handed parallel beta-helix repeat-containing protein [Phycisphaerales bacterium]